MIRKLACIAFFASFFIVMSNSSIAQDFSAYQKKWLVQGADTLPYRLLLPEQYDASKTYPVIFFYMAPESAAEIMKSNWCMVKNYF